MPELVADLLAFLDRSPTPYHAVAEARRRLEAAGFRGLEEGELWDLSPGDRHWVVRGDASLVAFAPADDDTALLFSTLRATRKYQNLVADSRVALLISNHENRSTDLRNAAAVTALGQVGEVEESERSAMEEVLLARHAAMTEFVRSPGCALLRVAIRSYYLVTRFQNVIELHVQDGTLRSMDPAAR